MTATPAKAVAEFNVSRLWPVIEFLTAQFDRALRFLTSSSQSLPDHSSKAKPIYLTIFNVSAGLDDFKPIHISDRFIGLRDCRADCIFDAGFRRTDNFKHFVNVILHYFHLLAAEWRRSFCGSSISCQRRRCSVFLGNNSSSIHGPLSLGGVRQPG
jgi:hypothetical protein